MSEAPQLTRTTRATWETGRIVQGATASHYTSAAIKQCYLGISYQTGDRIDNSNRVGWGVVATGDSRTGVPWGNTDDQRATQLGSRWTATPARNSNESRAVWEQTAERMAQALSSTFDSWTAPKEQRIRHDWDSTRLYQNKPADSAPVYLPGNQPLNFVFGGTDLYTFNYAPEVYFVWPARYRAHMTETRDTELRSVWYRHQANDPSFSRIPWGDGRSKYRKDPFIGINYPEIIEPEPGVEPEIPVHQEVYFVMNTVQINEMGTGAPLDAQNVTLSLDIDSFAWSFSADIMSQTSLNLIKPDATGLKQVEIIINGYRWVCIVERYSMRAQFPTETYRVSGASRTQYLGAPYAPQRNKSFSEAITAQQVVNEEIGMVGFSAVWQIGLPNWMINAGVYSYASKTPINVVSEIAQAVGAIIVPATDQDALQIKARYKHAPWLWASQPITEIQNVIIESMVLSFGLEWHPSQQYNAAYVSGIEAGRSVNVVRSGTAGDVAAPDEVGVLYLDEQQIASKAKQIICGSGNQSVMEIHVPLPPGTGAPGLIIPGNLVEYRNRANELQFRALCLSNSISIGGTGATKVIQQVKLERHHY